MVELQGLEPWTSSMPWKRSSQLSYSPTFSTKVIITYIERQLGYDPGGMAVILVMRSNSRRIPWYTKP